MADEDDADDAQTFRDLLDEVVAGANQAKAAEAAQAKDAPSPEQVADDRRFADLVAGAQDLFTEAVDRIRREADEGLQWTDRATNLRVDYPEEIQTDEQREAFDLLFQFAHQAEQHGDQEARAQHLADARLGGLDLWPEQHLAGRERRLERDRRKERAIVAEGLVRQLGAAGQAAADDLRESYLKLPRLQQAILLMLAGEPRAARRAAASSIVRTLPPLAEQLLKWMEEPDGDQAERQGLAIAAILDRKAVEAELPGLSRLATEVLAVSLQAPLTRIVDLAPTRMEVVTAHWGPALRERQATPTRIVAQPDAPLSADALLRMRLLSAGIAPLPYPEGRLSLAEPARRVAAALARSLQSSRAPIVLEQPRHRIDAKLEPVLFGIGLLLAGVETEHVARDRALVLAANHVGQQHMAGTISSFEIGQRRRIDDVQRRRAEEVKRWKGDLDEVLPRLDAARSALAKLGLDETGEPLGREEEAEGSEHATLSLVAIVCPKIEVKGNTKVKEAVAGHEHMLGEAIALAPVGDLPQRRRQLLAEFPWAGDVIDFILGDLVSRQSVTIRPVLLTGDPGSGKTHFARRFAHVFGLHLWSVDCGGSDGAVFAGTDRRWHSAEPSHPFLAMSRGRQANPLVLLDELEKAPTRADYGRLWDALLPFLDPGSNRAAQDRCLQVPIDASHINYIATANRVEGLPWPLRDRFRQIAFPEPAPEHLPALTPPLLAQLAQARGLDPRFIAPLTPEDEAFLARRWRGGSVRRLSRLIEAIVNARERAMPVN